MLNYLHMYHIHQAQNTLPDACKKANCILVTKNIFQGTLYHSSIIFMSHFVQINGRHSQNY